jgi:hypothetical protein
MLNSDNLAGTARMNEGQAIVKRSLAAYYWCLIAFNAVAWAASFFSATILHLGFPFSTFLFDPDYRFTDLTDLYVKIKNLDLGGEMLGIGTPLINYPAPALYVYAFFIRLFPNPVAALVIFTVAAAVISMLALRRGLTGHNIDTRLIDNTLVATAFCSYPFLFVIDRANLDGVVWFFTLLGLFFFVRERYLLSALVFAVAVCIKPFPALFFFLLLRQRRYKEIAVALGAVCVITLAALKAVGPTIAIAFRGLQPGVRSYFNNYVVAFHNREETFDHSAFSFVKQVIGLVFGRPREFVPDRHLLTAYIIWAPVCGLILIVCGIYFWRKPGLNQLFAVVLLILLLPPISGDYTLTELYLPWGAFMIFLVRDVGNGKFEFPLRKALWILIPLAILVTPQSYITFSGGGFAGQLKAVVLVILLFVVARTDMPSSLFGDLRPVSLTDRHLDSD